MSNPSERSEGDFYEPLVWSISTFLLVSGAVLSILMWTNVIGPFRFTGLPRDAEEPTVGLWVPHARDRSVSPETSRRLGRWRIALPKGTPVVAGNDLPDLVSEGVGVIVVADGRSLSALEAAALWEWVARGGAAILTGAVGVRDREGAWLGFGLMQSLLDEPAIHPLDRTDSQEISAWTRGPLSAGLAPGEVIRMAPEPGVPALATHVAELRWGASTDPSSENAGAAKRLEVGRGRVVWLAAGPESSLETSSEPWQPMVRLVGSALSWCTRRAVVEILAWPGGAHFGGLIQRAHDDDPTGLRSQEEIRDRLEAAARSGAFARIAVDEGHLPPGRGLELRRFASGLLGRRGGWRAPSDEALSAWRAQRDRLVAVVERTGPQRWLLKVSNLGDQPLSDAVVRVHLNRPVHDASIEGTAVLQESPRLRAVPGSEQIDVLLPEVPAGESRAYSVDVDGDPSLAGNDGAADHATRNDPAYRPGG